MLLKIRTTTAPATDLSYLLHKHPQKMQEFSLNFGKARVFYPEASDEACTVCLHVEIDPVGLVRSRSGPGEGGIMDQYVNDRPYAASSFLSVAMSQVFASALGGRCKDKPEAVDRVLDLEAEISVLASRGGEDFLRRLFEPLGYEVEATRLPLDPAFPDWGESRYFSLKLKGKQTLSALLTHLYVLIPVLDNTKHYWIGDDEVEKLLAKGEGWLTAHPEREVITLRYLRYKTSLVNAAIERLVPDQETAPDEEEKPRSEREVTLNEQRLGAVLGALKGSGAKRVLDLGCGEGRLVQLLIGERQFEEILAMDVSVRSLEIAVRRLRYERMPERQRARLKLIHGSLIYRDERLAGYDAAAIVEVIEHLDLSRLRAFERTVFEFARPTTVVITTPNSEYNVKWETLPGGEFRHSDHRFEWTRAQFQDWARSIAGRSGYEVRFLPIGPEDPEVGSPTQMGLFEKGDVK